MWTNKPFEPPIKRNVISERTTPNTSTVSIVCILPVFGSGRSSSKLFPRDTKISCDFVPEKLPCTACVIAVECCSVKLYKYMLAQLIWYQCENNNWKQLLFVCSVPILSSQFNLSARLCKTKSKTTIPSRWKRIKNQNKNNQPFAKSTLCVCLIFCLEFAMFSLTVRWKISIEKERKKANKTNKQLVFVWWGNVAFFSIRL